MVCIEKFALNSHEQDLIGSWNLAAASRLGYPITGQGMRDIFFFPNRIFLATRFHVGSIGDLEMTGRVQSIVGTWKVERNRLWISFICRVVVIDPLAEKFIERFTVEYQGDNTYYPIYRVHSYENFFINKRPFDMRRIPANVREFHSIESTDSRRGRRLFDTWGSPDFRKENPRGGFLFNPYINDEYIMRLVSIRASGNFWGGTSIWW